MKTRKTIWWATLIVFLVLQHTYYFIVLWVSKWLMCLILTIPFRLLYYTIFDCGVQPRFHLKSILSKSLLVDCESWIWFFLFSIVSITTAYSSVPNRRACMFINFEKKFPPAQPYLGLHVYWFWEKIPPARLFHPARVLVFVLHVY